MKRFLFLICLLGATSLFAQAMPLLEGKDSRGDREKRSIPSSPVVVEVSAKLLTLGFITPLGDLSIQIMDDYGVLIYEEVISVTSPQSYYIPMISSAENLRLYIKGNNIELELPLVY